jgi:hypothetical protein
VIRAGLAACDELRDARHEIVDERRARERIGDGLDAFATREPRGSGAEEARFACAEDPRRPHDPRARRRIAHRVFAAQLRRAVDVDRARDVIDRVRLSVRPLAVEHVVAAEVHDRRADPLGRGGEMSRSVHVDALRELRVRLAVVDADDRAVEDDVGTNARDGVVDRCGVCDVELAMRRRDDRVRCVFADECAADEPGAAGDQHVHREAS